MSSATCWARYKKFDPSVYKKHVEAGPNSFITKFDILITKYDIK